MTLCHARFTTELKEKVCRLLVFIHLRISVVFSLLHHQVILILTDAQVASSLVSLEHSKKQTLIYVKTPEAQ